MVCAKIQSEALIKHVSTQLLYGIYDCKIKHYIPKEIAPNFGHTEMLLLADGD